MSNEKKSSAMKTVELFDLPIVAESEAVFWGKVTEFLAEKNSRVKLLMTPNPEQIVLAEKEGAFKRNLQQADWLIPDGMGLIWGSKYLKQLRVIDEIVPERIAGADIVKKLVNWAEAEGKKVLVIGGFYDELAIGVEKEAGLRRIKLKTGQEVWWTKGFELAKTPTPEEKKKVSSTIEKLHPEIVLVALGAPEQEKWLVENQDLMRKNGVKLGMAVGGSLDFLTGKASRAPLVMQNAGLEWIFRLVKQPWRWRRQLALVEYMNLLAGYKGRKKK